MGKTYKDFGGVEGYAYDNFQHVANANGFPTNLFLNLLHNEDFRNKFVNVYCDYAKESPPTNRRICKLFGIILL